MEFVGFNGSVEVLEDRLIIKRSGFFSFLTNGFQGNTTIPLPNITYCSVQASEPDGQWVIQFTIKAEAIDRPLVTTRAFSFG